MAAGDEKEMSENNIGTSFKNGAVSGAVRSGAS
jgi:hypothetical protein